MKKFMVQLEAPAYSTSIDIEAETMEDAIKVAQLKHCGPRMVEVSPRPTWIEPYPEEEGAEIYELNYEYEGDCDDCGLAFLSGHRPNKDWPWTTASGDDGHYTTICYPCAMKRKEDGNYCPDCESFYSKHYCGVTGKDTLSE